MTKKVIEDNKKKWSSMTSTVARHDCFGLFITPTKLTPSSSSPTVEGIQARALAL
jgi:hypothetical protein